MRSCARSESFLDRIRQRRRTPTRARTARLAVRREPASRTLRGVVARGDEVDAELARRVQSALLRLSGEVQVVPLLVRLTRSLPPPSRSSIATRTTAPAPRRTRADSSPVARGFARRTPSGPMVPASGRRGRFSRKAFRERPRALRQQGVVADLRVRVQRQVVARQRQVGCEECLETSFHPPVDHAASPGRAGFRGGR